MIRKRLRSKSEEHKDIKEHTDTDTDVEFEVEDSSYGRHMLALTVLTIAAFATRLYRISWANKVIWDGTLQLIAGIHL